MPKKRSLAHLSYEERRERERAEWKKRLARIEKARIKAAGSASDPFLRERASAYFKEKYPECRIVHEVNLAGQGSTSRIDMIVVLPDRLIGVEVKGDKDVPDRLLKQLLSFSAVCDELWVFYGYKMKSKLPRLPHWVGQACQVPNAGPHDIEEDYGEFKPERILEAKSSGFSPSVMIELLWAQELNAVPGCAARNQQLRIEAALKRWEGDAIIPWVCAALASRVTSIQTDPPLDIEIKSIDGEWVPVWPEVK